METLAKAIELIVSLLFIACTLRGMFLEYQRKDIVKAAGSYESAVVLAVGALLIDVIKVLDGAGEKAVLGAMISSFLVVMSATTWVLTCKKIERERAAQNN